MTEKTTAGDTKAEKYIKLEAEFTDFDDKEVACAFHFRKPSPQEMARANKEAQKNGERAFKNLTLALVKPEELENYKEIIREYPGVATSFANDIYQRMGYGSLGK